MLKFEDSKDVWDYIDELIKESKTRGSQFNLLQDIYEQLPFFVCLNVFLDKKYQKDISKYLYCRETGVPPHKGDYGDQPSLWLEKYYIIKNAIDIRDNMIRDKHKNG